MSDSQGNRAVGDPVERCPLREFFLQIVDGDDEDKSPLQNVPYVLICGDGSELRGETDSEGYIRRRDVPEGDVTIIIDDESWVVLETDV